MRFQVLTAKIMNATVFWDVAPQAVSWYIMTDVSEDISASINKLIWNVGQVYHTACRNIPEDSLIS